ncbi:hypothetical protein I6E26_03490 [Anaerovibrio lipolyticus]|uniref:hypothetical protein n=1 Tax=Anaerovibrio lipolyticus TaxID=82374 RepID=UPI001F3E8F1B|nr:hypothetical protein [Anaerovibrio lipolyticus]MCF2600621.1 hypothetical protein [Anaerovibrio lipolyticus]
MSRKVLLIEPNYKNKYPPMSLMKLATYHRRLGDEVTFYKGNDVDFAVNETMKLTISTLYNNDRTVNWNAHWDDIALYLRKGSRELLETLYDLSYTPLVKKTLESYRRYYHNKMYLKNPQWDRVCVTTLFTFYWAKTVDAINYYKQFCKDPDQVFVGGISASVMPHEMEQETGIKPIVGLLDKGGELDDNDIIIDKLPLDYSILEEIDYKYPEHDGYYGYMTRGCVNKCAFCVVPKLEPTYQTHISIKDKIEDTRERFGEKRNLLLLDNNVLASADFDNIIEEIKESGFTKENNYIAPDYYAVAIKNIRDGYNIPAYIKSLRKQYDLLLKKTADIDDKKEIIDVLSDNDLDDIHTMTVENILAVDDFFAPKFEKIYKNKPKARYVDFNQGIDSRLINEENIKKLAEIPVRPLRIAFDHWKLRDVYEKSVRLAAEHGITHLSNYLLYNFKDKPIELYYRMKKNVDLCDELGISIYSFPMKYHPIQDPKYFRDRTYLGKHWNRKFIRSVQAILNSTKGKIGRGKSFFDEAFGKDDEGFWERMYMPEAMIIYRFYYKENGLEPEWWEEFRRVSNISSAKKQQLEEIIGANDFSNIESLTSDEDILRVLRYYTITRDDFESNK